MTGGQPDTIDYTLTKTSLYEQVADTLEKAIIGFDGKAEKLPSEQELSKRFNVSRSVIREALRALKERGLVESRNGEGSYTSKPNSETVTSALGRIIRMDNISNDDLHGIRLILEIAAVRLAAQNADSAGIERMLSILSVMSDTSLPVDTRVGYDADFHISIARAGGNVLLEMFVDVMNGLLKNYMTKGISGMESIEKTLCEHRKIVSALERGDADEAENAMREHLNASRKDVFEYERSRI